MYFALCAAVFAVAYLLNILTVSVGYHRALAHRSIDLHPALQRLVVRGGNWLTGLDPKAWIVMHRLHHEHSDTPLDPHSPVNVGILGIPLEQLRNYERVIIGLLKQKPEFTRYARDLDFPLNALTRAGRWYVPYLVHAAVALALGFAGGWLLGVAYFLGMMSHPVQGAIVNALGHAWGGRNFDTPDNSRNNHLAALLILGEGFQNNHHRFPGSATFAYRRHEIDAGFGACLVLERLGLAKIDRAHLIPAPPRLGEAAEAGASA